MSQEDLKRTPLHDAHVRAGARIVPFAGYAMPVQYAGVMAEHHAVREGAGVFDVSHMGEFRVTGPQALDFLQFATTNDVGKLKPGRAQYNLLPNERGGLVDDIYVYMLSEGEYFVVVNAANVDKDFAHLQGIAARFDVNLVNESDAWGLLAVQGPKAAELLQRHADLDLSSKKKNSVFKATLFDFDVMLARTGYTGEDGFEIFVKADEAEVVWDKLLAVGFTPAGLGARDTLRLEAGFPLYGHEFGDDIHPLSSHYTWAVKDKAFHGREHILEKASGHKLVGLTLDKVIAREGAPVKSGGEVIGRVTSGSMSPTLKVPIAMALIDANCIEDGELTVEIRGKEYPARVTALPFLKK
ncbi:glycine cleavage system aminomethyltransferase GcvT [Deinococcus yavapaiensis]|uniref:Aminomethyltransferase n=1 Tax=Deinococcus yavapaiensis KR-236 TaxID=694435 RepID=A0A318S586_9DEIO|nr:glycine cleavage system aminomethyltransferase GcvT [Deinococcus yavapaiensis]PYE53654.1 aminomethyltransferase [Deinococcus yavapaiensis KR-236]